MGVDFTARSGITPASGDSSTRYETTAFSALYGVRADIAQSLTAAQQFRARQNLGFTRTPVPDVAYTALATDAIVAYTALTAARVVTLPASSAYPVGTILTVVDESGSCSATNTITLTRAGSDTVNGATTAVISTAYGYLAVESNGAGKWTILDAPGSTGTTTGTLVGVQLITASGTYTRSPGVTRVLAYVLGGGGASSSTSGSGASGGGSGEARLVTCSPNATETVTIGAGGTTGAGGATSFGSYCTANGGGAGSGTTGGGAGSGGTGGVSLGASPGGGGGTTAISGGGGGNCFGPGPPGRAGSTGAGVTGTVPGTGASGGAGTGSVASVAGAAGAVLIFEYK